MDEQLKDLIDKAMELHALFNHKKEIYFKAIDKSQGVISDRLINAENDFNKVYEEHQGFLNKLIKFMDKDHSNPQEGLINLVWDLIIEKRIIYELTEQDLESGEDGVTSDDVIKAMNDYLSALKQGLKSFEARKEELEKRLKE